ncbi:MAG: hypothetical protein WCP77_19730, partial [Roseococcus sp.]
MFPRLILAGAALLVLAGPAALAQSAADQETRQLIERLRPSDALTRGIRVPGAAVAPEPAPAVPGD